MKLCCTCKEQKEFRDFYKSTKSVDGYQRQCKACKRKSNKSEHNKQRCKKYRENNPDKSKKSSENWRLKNPKYGIEYYHSFEDKQKFYDRGARYIRERYNKDATYRTYKKIHSQVCSFLKGKIKNTNTSQLLQYSMDDFIKKYGSGSLGCDIDHKIPITWFNEDTPISIIWHLDNLQWLDSKQNKTKGNRYADAVVESYLQMALPYIKEEFIAFLKK
jgi:hypothetical protein